MEENLLIDNEFIKISFSENPEIKVFKENNLEGLACFKNDKIIFKADFDYCSFDQLDNVIHLKKNDIEYSLNFYLKKQNDNYLFYLSHYKFQFSEKQTWTLISNDEWEPSYGLYSNLTDELILPISFKKLIIAKLDSEKLFFVFSLSDSHLKILKNGEKEIISKKLKLNEISFLKNKEEWEINIFNQNYESNYLLTEDEFFKFGLISLTGEILLKNEYQSIVLLNEQIFLKKYNKLFLYSRIDNSIMELIGVEKIFEFSLSNLFLFSQKNRIGAFDKNGKITINPEYDQIISINRIGLKSSCIDFDKQYQNKYFQIVKNDKIGYVSNSGKVIIKPIYDFGNNCSNLINVSTFFKQECPQEKTEKHWIQVYYNGEIKYLDASNNLKEIQHFIPNAILPKNNVLFGNGKQRELISIQ